MARRPPQIPPARWKLLAVAVPLGAAVVTVAAILAGGGVGGDDADEAAPAATTSTTALSGTPTPTSADPGDGTPATTVTTPAPPTTAPGPAAPWRAAPLARAAVPEPFLEAWGRARNRSSCALLVPADAGPALEGATASYEPTSGDAGWDVYLRQGGAVVEVLGLFTGDGGGAPGPPEFSTSWPDGSVARYGPDSPGGPDGTPADLEETSFEAVLSIPGQECAYRIYDSLGKSHLEGLLEALRFVEDAP